MKLQKYLFCILLLITAAIFLPHNVLYAQNADEDLQFMKEYKLPQNAVAETELTAQDSLMLKDGKPFTGTAYVRYANNQLQRATQYVNGLKHGTMLVWYPDGKPQLLATYRKGRLNGKFKGWYQFGAVIYDLVLKDNAFVGDQLSDSDTGRETGSDEDNEFSGDGIDQSNE